MRLTVDYLLVHEGDVDCLHHLLMDLLEIAMEENDLPAVDGVVQFKYSQPAGNNDNRRVSAFRLEADVDDEISAAVLESFQAGLSSPETDDEEEEETAKVLHVLKFGDPLLKRRLAQYADELFDLEMVLREALSTMFLIQYGDDFHNLLQDVTVKITSKEEPQEDQMKAAMENEFFHLLFSQYTQLNERETPKQISQLLDAIDAASSYEEFRREIMRHPIEEESYRDFIASLKERMDAIERLRNCVAHNRTIPGRIQENYEKARDELNQRMAEFLGSLSEAEDDPEPAENMESQ